MVHFVTEADAVVQPLCGEWGGVPNWTKIESAVSCRRCLALLGGGLEARRPAVPPARPLAKVILLDPHAGA